MLLHQKLKIEEIIHITRQGLKWGIEISYSYNCAESKPHSFTFIQSVTKTTAKKTTGVYTVSESQIALVVVRSTTKTTHWVLELTGQTGDLIWQLYYVGFFESCLKTNNRRLSRSSDHFKWLLSRIRCSSLIRSSLWITVTPGISYFDCVRPHSIGLWPKLRLKNFEVFYFTTSHKVCLITADVSSHRSGL